MATKPVKHFFSSFAGAPNINGQAGSLIAVLDACLVDGFNSKTLDSLVVSGNVLTGTKSGHNFVVDQVIATSANEASLIGEWTITSVTATTFSAAAPGVSNVTGTGTLTVKAAGAGWTKLYAGTNKAVYKSSDVAGNGCVLRVDDTGTTTARVVGYESMTDIDTGIGPFPTAAQVSGGAYWFKSATADVTARNWEMYADSQAFYFAVTNYTAIYVTLHGFGQLAAEKPGDAFATFLAGQSSVSNLTNNAGVSILAQSSYVAGGGGGLWAPRSYTQVGSAITLGVYSNAINTVLSGESTGSTYPSPCSNGLILSSPCCVETTGLPVRSASVPGLFHTPQANPLDHRQKIADVSGLDGRTLVASSANGYKSGASQAGKVFIDITGPWR